MIGKAIKLAVLFMVSILVIGELDFRVFGHNHRLEYDVDKDLYWRLRADQKGFEWLANMTKKSPPISINSQGFRGDDLDNTKGSLKRVLALGSSSALGAGVTDEEVWTERLEGLINSNSDQAVILNAANPGWGPFQHAKFIEREAQKLQVQAVIVMVSKGDLNFLPYTDNQAKEEYLKRSAFKKRVASFSSFLTFSFRKLETILIRVKARLKSQFRTQGAIVADEQSVSKQQETLAKVEMQKQFWQSISDLADRYKLPTIFMVLKPDNGLVVGRIEEIVSELGKNHEYVSLVSVDTTHLNQQRLVIAGDGHPNAHYHEIMAENVVKPLNRILKAKRLAKASTH